MALISKSNIKYLVYKSLPLDLYLKLIFKKYHGQKLNIKNPKRYSEKLFWLKKYNGKKENLPLIRKVYDKYVVKSHIEEKGFGEYLPTLYGVYDDARDIDFNKLPSKYVIKISQSNGKNFINNGFEVNKDQVVEEVNNWLKASKDLKNGEKTFKEEHYYFDGNSKIIVEEYLCKDSGEPCTEYLVFCFNGKPRLISVEIDYINEDGSVKKDFKRNTYDTQWNFVPVNMGRNFNEDIKVEKPKFLDKILEISEKLSEDFTFTRVDFYDRDDKLYIGEVTFIPQGGTGRITPERYDELLGSWLKLPFEKEEE